MKKTMLVLAILLYTGVFHEPAVKAPASGALVIFYSEGFNPFNRIYFGVCTVESGMDSLAYNPNDPHGGSHGISQIGTKRLRDYNRRTGKQYTIQDLYKPAVSREIFMFYAQGLGPYHQDLIVRKWNGSGVLTYKYLKKVKRVIST